MAVNRNIITNVLTLRPGAKAEGKQLSRSKNFGFTGHKVAIYFR